MRAELCGPDVWQTVRAFMRARCGVVFDDTQAYLLEARLEPVAREHGYPSVASFVWSATSNDAQPLVRASLIDAMTTHETRFFRDAPFWDTLAERLLDDVASRAEGGLRVWCAACSTGQEPYTLLMVLHDRRPEFLSRTRIVATDVAVPTIRRAQAGVFALHEVNRGLDAAALRRHFDATDRGAFRVRPHLTTNVDWRVQNLVMDEPPGGPFDVVLLRNVLIYFDEETRGRVLDRVCKALRPGGLLGVGSTELLPFERLAPGWFRPSPRGGG